MKLVQIHLLAILIFSSLFINAQDGVMHPYFFAPTSINPAFAGQFNENHRILTAHEQQWLINNNSSLFGLTNISYDYRNTINEKTQAAVGVRFALDRAGNDITSTSRQIAIQAAITRIIHQSDNCKQEITGGIEFGFASRQLNGISPDGNLLTLSKRIFDIAGGMNWRYSRNNGLNIGLGFSIHHPHQPNVSFFPSSSDLLSRRYGGQFLGEFPITTKVHFLLNGIYHKQGISDQGVVRTGLKYFYAESKNAQYLQITPFSIIHRDLNRSLFFGSYGCDVLWHREKLVIGVSSNYHSRLRALSFSGLLGYRF